MTHRLVRASALTILLTGLVYAQSITQTMPKLSPARVPQGVTRNPTWRLSKTRRLTAAVAPLLNVTGGWTDIYSYIWALNEDQSGNVSGTVSLTGCSNLTWSVSGSVIGNQLELTAANPAGGDLSCDSGFEYSLTLSSDAGSATGAWASDYGSGSVTMSRLATTPTIGITLNSQPQGNPYLITPPPAMPVIQASAAVLNVEPDPTPATVFTWTAALKIFEQGGSGSEVDYGSNIAQNTTTTGSGIYTLTFLDQAAFLGGQLTLTVAATVNGQVITATTPVQIYGTNPQRSAMQAYIVSQVPSLTYSGLSAGNVGDVIQRMACRESGQTQFSGGANGGTGPPLIGSDNGIGAMQVTTVNDRPDYFLTKPAIVFDWQTNTTAGLQIYQSKAKASLGYPGRLIGDNNAADPDSYQYYMIHTINQARTMQGLLPITSLPAPPFSHSGNIGSNPPNQLLEDAVRGYNGFSGTAPFNSNVLHEFVPNAGFLTTVPDAQLTTLSTNAAVWTRVCSNAGNGTLYGPVASGSCVAVRGSGADPAYVNDVAANGAQCVGGSQGN